MSKSDFDLDLEHGEIAEELLADILCGDRGNVTIEVKRDFRVGENARVAVEYRSRDQQSGISSSKARWWAYALSGPGYDGADGRPEVIVLIESDRLKKILWDYADSDTLKYTYHAGDGGSSRCYFVYLLDLTGPVKSGERTQ